MTNQTFGDNRFFLDRWRPKAWPGFEAYLQQMVFSATASRHGLVSMIAAPIQLPHLPPQLVDSRFFGFARPVMHTI
jgi:hypothetical protein